MKLASSTCRFTLSRASSERFTPKRLLILGSIICSLGLSITAATANDLFNANLDIIDHIITQPDGRPGQNNPCPVGWNVDADKTISGLQFDGGDSEPWCNVQDTGGYGFFFKPFVGTAPPPADLLTVQLFQDNSCTPGTKCTLSGYAAGEANYSGFFTTNSPNPATLFVVAFLDGSGNLLASNVYNLVAAGLPNSGPPSMALFTTPQYTAPANTATVRVGASIFNVYSTGGSQSFFVDAFDLETVPAPGSPVINTQPAQATVSPGGNASFTVGATGATSYQWQLNNVNLANVPGHISGATGPTLTITGAGTADVGHYRVRVSNASGALYSASAPLAIQDIHFYPAVELTGKLGDTYRVDYSTAVNPTTWIPLATNKLTTTPQLFIDTGSPGSNKRFYRSVFLF
jgi:hypothetical protein